MTDNSSLRKRALAVAAEARQLTERAQREHEKDEARRDAERRQELIRASISTVREILHYDTVAPDWKVHEVNTDDEGGYCMVYVASTTILGVRISTNPYRPPVEVSHRRATLCRTEPSQLWSSAESP